MSTRVKIDLNVRVHGRDTYVGLEDIDGPVAVGDLVIVFEPESRLEGSGRILEIDEGTSLVYLSVDWASLQPAADVSPVDPTLAETYRIAFSSSNAAAVTTGSSVGMHQDLVTAARVPADPAVAGQPLPTALAGCCDPPEERIAP